MAKVLGIGGAFMKAKDPEGLAKWYVEALNTDQMELSNTGSFGVSFDPRKLPETAYVQWSIMSEDTNHYRSNFMFNFIVDDIKGAMSRIESAGGKVLRTNYIVDGVGVFGWFKDPEGNQMELWEPIADNA